MNLTVVKADDKHIADIQNVAWACLPLICPDLFDESDQQAMFDKHFLPDDLSQAINNPDAWFYVMYDDDKFAGFGHLSRKPDANNLGLIHKLFVLPEYQDSKIVFKLFHHLLKLSTDDGITEIEIFLPECAKEWIKIFIGIGLEFEPWRKFERVINGKQVTMWPGLLVIIPDM